MQDKELKFFDMPLTQLHDTADHTPQPPSTDDIAREVAQIAALRTQNQQHSRVAFFVFRSRWRH